MKYRVIALLSCILTIFNTAYGRDIVIADKDTKQPIQHAKVSVWSSKSDKHLNVQSDKSGQVKIPTESVRISIHRFGYDHIEALEVSNSSDTVFMTPGNTLREISVSAARRNFIVKSDRYIYDVASDSALTGKSVLDALGRIPILNTTLEGNVSSMQGKRLIYKINGLVNPLLTGDLPTVLRNIKADYVKRIELSDNPNGNDLNAIEINIVTKGRLEGYQATATTRLADYSWRTTLWGLTKIKKYCVSGAYYYMLNSDHDEKTYLTETRDSSRGQIHLDQRSTNGGYKAVLNNAEVSMSYDIDDNTIISAFGRILSKSNPRKSSVSSTVITSGNNHCIASYSQTNKTVYDDKEYSASINFERKYGPDAEKGKLFVGYDFYKRPNDSYSNVAYSVDLCTDSLLRSALIDYTRREYIDLAMHTAMMEYRRNFMNRHTVQANATYRFRSDFNSDSIAGNIGLLRLNQHLLDGSVAYRYTAGPLAVNAGMGVRLYSDDISNTKYGPDYTFSRHNVTWQPSLSMVFVPTQTSRYELSYNMMSLIPGISVMNPFVFRNEPMRATYGNPNITPEKNQKLSLSANYSINRAYLGVSLQAGHTTDVILQYSYLDKDNVLNTTYDNIAKRWDVGLSSFLSCRISPNTLLRGRLSLDYIDYNSPRLLTSSSGLQFVGNMNLTQELPFGIYGEFQARYNSPWINAQGRGGENYGYGMTLMRRFISNKMTVSLSAENFVPTYYTRSYTIKDTGFCQTLHRRQFHACYSLSVSYSLGNIRARVKSTETSISNTDIKRSYDE